MMVENLLTNKLFPLLMFTRLISYVFKIICINIHNYNNILYLYTSSSESLSYMNINPKGYKFTVDVDLVEVDNNI
jgi:hypothetical protein